MTFSSSSWIRQAGGIHVLATLLLCIAATRVLAAEGAAEYVIQISVDGLAPKHLETLLAEGKLPTFARWQREGAWTHNARTDFDYTITLPNHTCMVTCRPVKDRAADPTAIAGHVWTINSDPGDRTLHNSRLDYVASSFDVAHDNGLRTALLASKSKFVLYDQSYDARNGAADTTGEDNGRDKIDLYVKDGNTAAMTDRFIEEMKSQPFNYTFLHYADTDSKGHAKGWGSPEYMEAVVHVDGQLARIVELVTTDERFKGKTTIILSADHGGLGLNHGINSNVLNYTIPFYVWGAGVAPGRDLYELNTSSRANPQTERPDYTGAPLQPIRNGDGGNLALSLLGLGPIPGSLVNAAQDLSTQ
ncbi:MAG: alkaline phosphatase family protein [Pirellulales bacterium]